MDLLALDSTYGHLLLLHLNKILVQVVFVPVSHPVGHIRYLLLQETTTSVNLGIHLVNLYQHPSLLITLSGMAKDVVLTARPVNLMIHHGSRQSCHRLPEMVSNYASAMINQTMMRMLLLI